MKKTIKALLFLLPVLLGTACTSRNEFFISPNGDDGDPGTRGKPFASIERARMEVREAISEGLDSDITVWIEDGRYLIDRPIEFASGDSGRNGFTIHYRALPGESPVLSGGHDIKGWQKEDDALWSASIAELQGISGLRELFINGTRAPRARTPNAGYLRVKKAGDDHRTNFYYESGAFPPPDNPETVEIVLLHDWSISRVKVKNIDLVSEKITAVDSIGVRAPSFYTIDHWEPHPRYYLENSLSFLDADNEWFYDESQKKVYLRLPPGMNPEECSISIPVSEGLIILAGTPESPVGNLRFEGMSFSHSTWKLSELGYSGLQATHFDPRPQSGEWAVVDSAVKAEWVENCVFTNCHFSHLGGGGLWLAAGCRNCLVEDSVFTDISGNGIMIGEGRDRMIDGESWWKSAPEQAAKGNRIENCTITECGRQFFGAVGIWCGLVAETTITGNEISNLPYTGVSIGWMWDPQPTPCRENIIEENHIHHIMQVLSDGGGIYMLGLQPGSRLVNNHIHDVKINAGKAESNGMFIDEGSTGLVIANNLIYNIAKSPLRFHKATTNLVRDNYLFCSGDNPPIRYNRTLEEDIQKSGNSVFYESDPIYREKLAEILDEWQ